MFIQEIILLRNTADEKTEKLKEFLIQTIQEKNFCFAPVKCLDKKNSQTKKEFNKYYYYCGTNVKLPVVILKGNIRDKIFYTEAKQCNIPYISKFLENIYYPNKNIGIFIDEDNNTWISNEQGDKILIDNFDIRSLQEALDEIY